MTVPIYNSNQLWRVFSPNTREAMPWCATWETLASSALTCHLLNEIRAPEPGLDPFIGLDIPHHPLPTTHSAPILTLPSEILYLITDHLDSLSDTLSLSLTCRPLLSICLRQLRVSLHDRMRGRWINTPLICLGSLTSHVSELPRSLRNYEPGIVEGSTNAYRRTYTPGTRATLFYTLETTHYLLKNYDKIQASPEITPAETQLPNTRKLPPWTRRLIERALLLDSGRLRVYSTSKAYILRNLSRKEFLRFSAAEKIRGELESVFFSSTKIPLDQAVTIIFLFLISWSPSNAGLEDEMVRSSNSGIEGRWAGGRFDVVDEEKFKEEGWVDVEEQTLLSLRLYLPRMWRNVKGMDRWGEDGGRREVDVWVG